MKTTNSLLLDFLFPPKCFFCQKYGHYFCSLHPPPLPCQHQPPSPLRGHLSLFNFNSPIRQLIYSLKYDFVTHLVPDLCQFLSLLIKKNYPHLLSYWQQHHFSLLPIPLHPLRRRFRGFNQSALLAQFLSPRLGLQYRPNLLFRSRFTLSQAQKDPASRYQLSPVFSLNSNQKIPSHIILVDDVVSTFATLVSAASVFPSSTAVWSLTLAT